MSFKKLYIFLLQGLPIVFFFWVSLITIIIHKNDGAFEKNWLVFYLWLITFVLSLLYSLFLIPKTVYSRIYVAVKKEWPMLLFLVLLALASHFFLIKEYPYIKIGDQLRDVGFNGLQIKQGITRDVFGFGSYNGYGNFAPLIGYFFSFIFGISPYMYLIPAALVGALSVMATYIYMRIGFDKKKSFIAALFLLALPLHLYYSRNELVVISDSLLSIVILIITIYTLKNHRVLFLLGLIYGLSLQFYAGIRGVIVISFVYILLQYVRRWIQTIGKQNIVTYTTLSIKKIFIWLTILAIGIIIGAGPKLNNLTKDNLSGTVNGKLIIKDEAFIEKKLPDKFQFLNKTFTRSFLIYFSEETTSRVRNQGAFIPFPLNWFFMIGFFYILVSKKGQHNNVDTLLVFAAFMLPFTNETLINSIGTEHRLMSSAPIVAALIAIGFTALVESFFGNHRIVASYILKMTCILLISVQLWFFFYNRLSESYLDANGVREFVLQSVADYIHKDHSRATYYVVNNDPYELFMHHKEKMDFYGYPKIVFFIDKNEFENRLNMPISDQKSVKYIFFEKNYETRIIKNAQEIRTTCQKNTLINYQCPKNFYGEYHFFAL